MRIIPKNWSNFQHYKHRSPPWIKLHRNLLDDMHFQRLPTASKALAPMLWLLASESNEGVIQKTTEEIAFRLRMTEKEVITAIKPLIDNGFFIDADNVLADCLQDATTEGEKSRVECNVAKATKSTRFTLEEIPKEWIEFCNKERPDLNPHSVFNEFRDYWISVAGIKGVKNDWFATWRNWVRKQFVNKTIKPTNSLDIFAPVRPQ